VNDAPISPPDQLLLALTGVVEPWLQRILINTAAEQLGCRTQGLPDELVAEVMTAAKQHAVEVLAKISDLLGTDVDAQRQNPLALLRTAAIGASSVLQHHGVSPVARDDFEVTAFPLDHYRVAPASWVDIDPSLQDPGITWGAWKAAHVLSRRRQEGLR
jgi:hypothetical protein